MQKPPASPQSGSRRGGTKALSLTPSGGAWVLDAEIASGLSGTYPTRAAALEAARRSMHAKGGVVTVRIREDRVEEAFTLGRQAFEKISAVEGIRLSRAMKRDLLEARAKSGTPEEARRILAAKYGTPRL